MKKSLITLLAVVTLGILGLVVNKAKSSSEPRQLVTSPYVAPNTSSPIKSTPQSVSPVFHTEATYKDGTYSGSVAETPYGSIMVTVVINNSRIVDVLFLEMPKDLGYSREISTSAEPLLEQATLAVQSAQIAKIPDFVSGATSTVKGYQESLQAALDKAAAS